MEQILQTDIIPAQNSNPTSPRPPADSRPRPIRTVQTRYSIFTALKWFLQFIALDQREFGGGLQPQHCSHCSDADWGQTVGTDHDGNSLTT